MTCLFNKTQPFSTFLQANKALLKIHSTFQIEVPSKNQGIIQALDAVQHFHHSLPR